MTDLRVLLHRAAPTPAARVDIDALIAEADRRQRRRRMALWFGSIAVALGVGGGAAGVLAPADRPSEVNTLPTPTEHIRDPEISSPAHRTTTTTSRFSSASSAGTRSALAASSAPTPESQRTTDPEGCVSEGYPDGVGHNYTFVPVHVEYPECRYQATRPAGYEGSGNTWVVEIRREGEAIVYRGGESPDCMPVGTIQPGDEVIVSASGAGSYIKAGPEYGC